MYILEILNKSICISDPNKKMLKIKKGAVKTTTLFNILKKMNFIYSFGTETLLLIQQLNLITEPSFPSVKISVLLGALPV